MPERGLVVGRMRPAYGDLGNLVQQVYVSLRVQQDVRFK